MTRGFCEIGIYQPKTAENIGTLWRTAYQLGAAGIFTIGRRYERQCSDTYHSERHIPLRHYADWDAFMASRPLAASLIGVEMGGEPLAGFKHPQAAVYLLGSEDNGLPPAVLACCQRVVSIEAVRQASYNVAVAGALALYSRLAQKEFRE